MEEKNVNEGTVSNEKKGGTAPLAAIFIALAGVISSAILSYRFV